MASVAASCLVSCAPDELAHGPSDERSDTLDGCPEFADPVTTGRVTEAEILEASGLVVSRTNPGVFWTHNDGDFNNLKIHAIDRQGERVAELKVADTPIEDLEDLAIGPGPQAGLDYLYLADTGDNALARDEVSIVRILEPSLDGLNSQDRIELEKTQAVQLRFRYDDGLPHDAEALLVEPTSGELWIFTKRFEDDEQTLAFRAAPPFDESGVNLLVEATQLRNRKDLKGSVVAADISTDGTRIALAFKNRETRIWDRPAGQPLHQTLGAPACPAPRPDGQQEAVALSEDGKAFYMLPEGSRPKLSFVTELAPCHRYGSIERAQALVGATDVSGLAHARRHQERLWSLSDSAPGEERTTLVSLTSDGHFESELELPGAENVDWEDLAMGPGPELGKSYIYVGDIGDNDLERSQVQVYRLPEPRLGQTASELHRFDLVYPNATPHDAEAMVVDPFTGALYIFTRQRKDDDKTRVYRAVLPDRPQGPIALDKVYTAERDGPLDQTIVAADLSQDGLSLALAVKDGAPLILSRHPDAPLFEGLDQPACELPLAIEDNDSIAFDRDDKSLFFLPEGQDPSLLRLPAE